MKTLATTNVIAWSAFWIFGFLALSAPAENGLQMSAYALIAFVSLATGLSSYLKICRIGHLLVSRPALSQEV
ncbi:hypothetical protein [Pseudooceanicola onchidii]|uniref:hypothetical protein n=1 Tax=Pseudooceanicola onchidii TaxID=2562279 RepID=UPI0010AA5854|nr:hypothetical protein [Pseudooceanicola onchidii]